LENETEVLEEIFNGDYTWNKRYYGNYVWVEFVAEDDDNFALPLKIVE
jgi:hypothetical protein